MLLEPGGKNINQNKMVAPTGRDQGHVNTEVGRR